MIKKKLVIVATHPIQYHMPWFRELSKHDDIELTVLFGMLPNAKQQSTGFGKEFSWDIPLTEGYQWQQLDNKSKKPNLSGFAGVDCPGIHDAIKRFSPDAIIITGWHSKLLFQASFAAFRLNLKTIMRGESNAKKPRPWYVKLAHRALLSRFDAFLAIGKSNRQFFIGNGVNRTKILNAPYFIENKRFLEGIAAVDEGLQSIKLPSDNFCFVYAGKLIEKKNVQELLSAFALVQKKYKDCQMMIIGDGELRQQLEAFVKQHKLAVTFCGFVNQRSLPNTYALGDCFLLGSDYDETWGLVVNEAMVCGLPAIVSNRAGSSDDLIIEGETGFVYQYGKPQALASKMIHMLENQQDCKRMGEKAQQHVLENYSVTHSVNATIEALSLLQNS